MKSCFSLLAGLLFVFLVNPVKGQELIKNSSVTGVCYAGTKINRIYIPPPDAFLKKSGTKGGGSVTIYYTGFPVLAKDAMERARAILESILPSDTKLTILASWEVISNAGVLANTVITGYAGGWSIDALNPLAYYPVALAEKIAGESLNPDLQGDLELRINSSKNWYLGTDGKTPVTKYDLITVAIHEICHGLGFFDTMNTDENVGYYGAGTIPMIYDTFIETLSGSKLTDTSKFENPSAALRNELTGGNLWFNGPLLRNFTNGTRAKLYAPSTWDPGSSISHLDESSTLEVNSLMTPFIDLAEAIHDPGKLTLSILGDLGWVNTRIIHHPMGDTEDALAQVPLSIVIKSDTLYNRDKVGVVFSFDDFLTSDTIFMTSPDSRNTFNATVNIPSYNTDLQYYFFVEDYFKRLYRSPSMNDIFRYEVYIGSDTVKPVITHTPPDYYLETVDSVGFKATVTDNLGVDTVYVEYKLNDGISKLVGLKRTSDIFSASLNAGLLNLNGGDTIRYRIFAIDSSLAHNISVLPKTGFFAVGIEDIKEVVESYSTDFTNAASDFLNKGFEVMKPPAFAKFGLHSDHPYVSPENNDVTYDFSAMLRYPLKMNESGLFIRFNEVVLVEPGEDGSVFGSDGFYDYVIIDGSKDFGKSWFPLINGYDSRYQKSWETAYNNAIVGQNSTFTGTEAMLVKHSVYYRPDDNIATGDTFLLRFRLFSDPYANGWGWVIEDLSINPLIDNIESNYSDDIILYPNPGNGILNIRFLSSSRSASKPLRFRVFNSSGTCLIDKQSLNDSEVKIDLSAYSNGIYIIVLYRDDGIKTFKYSLIR